MRRVRLDSTIALVVLGATIAGPGLATTHVAAETERRGDAFRIKQPDYRGRFLGFNDTRSGRILIEITKRTRRGKPLQGRIQPLDVVLDCQGSGPPRQRFRLAPYVIYFHDRGRHFQGQSYGFDLTNGYESVYLFRGRLERRESRAEGNVTILDNINQVQGQPYCSATKLPWSAKRQPGAGS